jgi:hypothetical protein
VDLVFEIVFASSELFLFGAENSRKVSPIQGCRSRAGMMEHMKKTGRPPFLTEQEIASQLDAVASIRRGLAQARKGAGRPADEVFDELEREDAGR